MLGLSPDSPEMHAALDQTLVNLPFLRGMGIAQYTSDPVFRRELDLPLAGALDGVPTGLIGYEEHIAGSKGRHLNFVFVADVDTQEVTPNEEFTQWRWVDSMEGLTAPLNVGQLLEVALRGGNAF